nr:hypothetical protein [Tanacetum cinerariifolium]
MRTRSLSNFPVVSSNPSTSKRRYRRRSQQLFTLEESPVDTMVGQRTMAELLRAPTEGYAEAIVVPPILAKQFELKHNLINMMTSNQFFGIEKDNPHDHIRWFNKITSTIKYKDVLNSAIKLMLFPFSLAGAARRTTNLRNEISNFQQRFDESFHEAWDRYKDLLRACPHHGFTELHKLDTFYNALNPADQDSLNAAAGGNLLERRTQDVDSQTHTCSQSANECCDYRYDGYSQIISRTPPPAYVKAVEETCVTCGGAHPYYQCLAASGNTFLKLRDNIQGYVSAAAIQYNQGNLSYRPPGMANQSRPPGPAQQNQNVHLNELEKVRRMNEANMKAMQTQIDMVKNKLRNEMKNSIKTSLANQTNEIKNMMASLLQMNTASTSGSGSLPSNTVANPKGELKAITTRSRLVIDGPTVPTPSKSINPEVDERVEETFTDSDLTEYTIKVPPPPNPKYKPPSQREFFVHQRDHLHPNIPYPSRMLKQKQQEKDEVQIYKFWQMFKQLHINITLADALILMPKYQKMLKALLSNKEKLQELANTHLNENCSAIILKRLPEKLRDPGKFLIQCGFSELKCKALADLGASINFMPLFVWKKLGLPELISTRMTLELANRAICTPAEIARDSPPYLGRPFLRTARALIDVHGEEMILRDGDEKLILNMRHDTSSYSNQPQIESINLINVFNNSSEDFLEDLFSNKPSGNPTFSSHPKLTSPKVNIFDSKGGNVLSEKLLYLDSTKDLHPPLHDDTLSGSTTLSSNPLLEEFADELAFLSKYNDDLQVDALPSTNNEDKIFNPGILIQEKYFEIITRVVQDKKLATSNASSMLEDFDPPFYEPLFFKEVPSSKMLLPFSSKNKELVFKPGTHTSKKVHSSFILELSHPGYNFSKSTRFSKAR